jgi:exoribonuclease R
MATMKKNTDQCRQGTPRRCRHVRRRQAAPRRPSSGKPAACICGSGQGQAQGGAATVDAVVAGSAASTQPAAARAKARMGRDRRSLCRPEAESTPAHRQPRGHPGLLAVAKARRTPKNWAQPGLTEPDRFEALSRRLARWSATASWCRTAAGLRADPDPEPGHRRGDRQPGGFGFLRPVEGGDDLFLPPYEMRKVMHGDKVLARVTGIDHRGRREGSIARARARHARLIGRFSSRWASTTWCPTTSACSATCRCRRTTGGARDGQLVVCELTQAPDAGARRSAASSPCSATS